MNSSLSFDTAPSPFDVADAMSEIVAQCDTEKRQTSGSTPTILVGLSIAFAFCSVLLLVMAIHLNTSRSLAANKPAAPAIALTSYLPWYYSYEDAQRQSAASGKLMLVDFTTDWCGVCKEMEASTFNDPAVIAEAQNVVPVKINAEVRTDLAEKYGINSYPTFVWMDANGNERSRVSRGYDAAGFVNLMQSNR